MQILFVTSNRIGDAVLSTGLLGHLVEAHPQARLTIACGPAPAPLFADLPGLARLIVLKKRRLAGHWLTLWAETAARRWNLVVDLRASAFAWTVPAAKRRTFRPSREPLHRVRQLARVLGLDPPPAPRLWFSDARRAEAAARIPPGGPVLAVGPTANWAAKQWPAEHFVEAVARLTGADGILSGARIAVLAAPNERAAALPVIEAVPQARRIDLADGTDLLTAAACLARCSLYIGNDSGLMHVAAASGVPTLGLFGPSPEALYAPWGPKAAFVRTQETLDELVGGADFDHRRAQCLMEGLRVDDVVAAAGELWRRCV